MDFVRVAGTAEIQPGSMKVVKLGETDILVVNIGGQFHAIANKCTHMGGSLGDGKLEGKIVTCPRHGSKFDVTTGKSVAGAKVLFVKLNVKDEPVYEVKVEGSEILLRKA